MNFSSLKTKTTILMLSGAAVLGATTANAYEPLTADTYIGGQFGDLQVDSNDFDDDTDAFQVRLGAELTPYIGFEIGYHDFGDFESNLAQADVDGYSLAAVGRLPLNDVFGFYVKAGQLWWDADYSVIGFNGSEKERDIFYGVGAEMEITESLDLVLAYDRYKINIENNFTSNNLESDLNFASVGASFAF